MEQLSGEGAYLMDNGRLFILWLGRNIPSGYIGELFAADPSTLAHDLSGVAIEPEKQTEVSRRICTLLRKLRMDNWVYQQCFVVRQVKGRIIGSHDCLMCASCVSVCLFIRRMHSPFSSKFRGQLWKHMSSRILLKTEAKQCRVIQISSAQCTRESA